MYKGKLLALTALLACAVNAQTPPQAVSAPAPAASAPRLVEGGSRSSIATITELSQQLKIEQLRKDLREAKSASASEGKTAQGMSGAPSLAPSAVGPGGAKAKPEQPTPPMVRAIYGQGGVLTARLADGRELGVGHKVLGWVVKRISPISVSFERCEFVAKPKHEQDGCLVQVVGPSPV
jgi:type IV pilus biogenesis protein PilP